MKQMNKQMDGSIDRSENEWLKEDEWTNGKWRDAWTHEQMDGWIDGISVS